MTRRTLLKGIFSSIGLLNTPIVGMSDYLYPIESFNPQLPISGSLTIKDMEEYIIASAIGKLASELDS